VIWRLLSQATDSLSIQPGSQYAKDKSGKLKPVKRERSEPQGKLMISPLKNGDQAFSESRYDVATGHYKNALTLFPDENYPKEQLASIKP
jgi:hypothetical protein